APHLGFKMFSELLPVFVVAAIVRALETHSTAVRNRDNNRRCDMRGIKRARCQDPLVSAGIFFPSKVLDAPRCQEFLNLDRAFLEVRSIYLCPFLLFCWFFWRTCGNLLQDIDGQRFRYGVWNYNQPCATMWPTFRCFAFSCNGAINFQNACRVENRTVYFGMCRGKSCSESREDRLHKFCAV